MKTTSFTHLFTLIIALAATLLVSCAAPQHYSRGPARNNQRGYTETESSADNGYTYHGGHSPRKQGRQGGEAKIVEKGRQGHILQRRHADGTPVGKPIWVPGRDDPDTVNGLPANHHTIRMSEDNLEKVLGQLNEPRQ